MTIFASDMAQLGSMTAEKTHERVAVVAAGAVSPLGFGLAETLDSLRLAKDCVTPVTRFSVAECRCKTAGQVPDDRLYEVSESLRSKRFHRASHMMVHALREAMSQVPRFEPELMVIGTTSGGMSYGEQYYRSLRQSGNLRHAPTWIANYPAQKPVIDAQKEVLDVSVPCQVIANACASGTNAIGHAFECVRSGRYQRVMTGGYDALSELVFTGFDSLQASTPEKCRPFDRHRAGMVLGEGAAILALENLKLAQERGTPVLAEIIGYGISTDNFHITQPNPSGVGPRQAMERAVHRAHISPEEVDYVNAHGTATIFNDAAEGKAISALFNGVPVSSTKSMMGHSLGAAGAVEAVVCLLALTNQFLPPNINFDALDDGLELNIVANKSRPAVLRTALSNSFGFGGTNASILMRRVGA